MKLLKNASVKIAAVSDADFERAVENYNDQFKGGLSDGKSPEDFPREALRKGLEVELEHVNDLCKAIEIAMDHLVEDVEYYDKLAIIEKEAGVIDWVKDKIKKLFPRGCPECGGNMRTLRNKKNGEILISCGCGYMKILNDMTAGKNENDGVML
jgi:hypothetical protein